MQPSSIPKPQPSTRPMPHSGISTIALDFLTTSWMPLMARTAIIHPTVRREMTQISILFTRLVRNNAEHIHLQT